MIIVSQDKEMIVNFNNIESIEIVADLYGTGKVLYKVCYETNSKREELGAYKTEERAKEVLQEIIESINGKSSIVMTNEGITSKFSGRFYEMPED